MKKACIVLAVAVLALCVAYAEPAVSALLDAYQHEVGVDAYTAAQYIEPPDGMKLSDVEMEIYRLAFAEGYWSSENPEEADLFMEYHLNINSKKFHRPSCMSAISMSAQNRQIEHRRRSEIINMGFVPCKMCNP